MLYGIIIAILVILLCILFLPIRAELTYKENMTMRIRFSRIPVYKMKLRDKNEKKKEKTPEEKAQKLEKDSKKLGEKIDGFRDFYKLTVSLVKRHVSLEDIQLKVDVGVGEAPLTAIVTGALWGAIYGLLGKIGNICYIKKHEIQINPIYNETKFSIEGKCIFKSNLAYIIFIAITILMKIKSRKGKHTGVKPNMVL